MYDLSTLEKGPLALITNPLTALWKGLMARATTIGAYMGLILGLGHVLFLTIYIYRKGLRAMCAPLRTVWRKAASKKPGHQGRDSPSPTTDDSIAGTRAGTSRKPRSDRVLLAGRNLLQDAKIMYHLARPTEPPPRVPSHSRELEVLSPSMTTPPPPAYSSASRGTPNKRDTLHYSQARYGLLTDYLQ